MAALGLALGCVSPTLPLPPPSRPNIDGPDESGQVTLSGSTRPAVSVYADNLDTGQSAGQRTHAKTGAYRFRLGARVGDTISLFYRYGTEESLPVEFKIPERAVVGVGGATGTGGIVNFAGSSPNGDEEELLAGGGNAAGSAP